MVSRPQEVSTDAEKILYDTVNRREPLELSVPIPSRVHEDVEDVTGLIPGAPQVLLATLESDEQLVLVLENWP